MPGGSGSITAVNPNEVLALNSYATFNSGTAFGPQSYVSHVHHGWGKEPSYALVHVPLANVAGDLAPAVAGVPNGPEFNITMGMACDVFGAVTAGGDAIKLIKGTVTDIDPDLKTDFLVVTVSDIRHLLRGVAMKGHWALDLESGGIKFVDAVAIYNEHDTPNAIWANAPGFGLVPVFCPPFYGNGSNTLTNATATIPAESAQSQDQSSYWTPSMVAQNMRWHTSQDAKAAVAGQFPEYSAVPDHFVWPAGVTDALNDLTQAQGQTSQDRKAKETSYHCHFLIDALEDVCKWAGYYEPAIQFTGDADPILAIVRTKSNGQDAVSLQRALSGNVTTEKDKVLTGFNEGRLKLSCRDTYTVADVVGARPKLEFRVSSSLGTTNGEDDPDVSLSWLWSNAEMVQAKADLIDFLTTGSTANQIPESILKLFNKYPRLFAQWGLNPSFNLTKGTQYASFYPELTQNQIKTNRVPLKNLLSSILNTDLIDKFTLLNSRRRIPVEYSYVADDSAWVIMDDNNGLEIDGDGTLNFTSLRSAQKGSSLPSPLYNILCLQDTMGNWTVPVFSPARLRITLACPLDHAISQAFKLAFDPTQVAAIPPSDLQSDDNNRIDPTYHRTICVDNRNYTYEERYNSFPIPESAPNPLPGGDGGAPAANGMGDGAKLFGTATILRFDQPLLSDHAVRKLQDHGRLQRGGTIFSPTPQLTLSPGTNIRDLSGYILNSVVKSYDIQFDKPQRFGLTMV